MKVSFNFLYFLVSCRGVFAMRANNLKSSTTLVSSAPVTVLNLTELTTSEGFTVIGNEGSSTGYSVGNAGDVNLDTFSDIIIGAPDENKVYVIYGNKSLPGTIALANLTSLQGFSVVGVSGSKTGWSVSGECDVNGDGNKDIIIGAPYANSWAGVTYVVYGNKSLPGIIALANLTSSQGFSIMGVSGSNSGWSVSCAGNVNGDPYDDIIIGAPLINCNGGASYVIYGSMSPKNISLSSLSYLQGLTILGVPGNCNCRDCPAANSGWSVSGAGDFDGDNFDDVIIGAPGNPYQVGKAYVIYVHKIIFASSRDLISLSDLTQYQGLQIIGDGGYFGYSLTGWSVSGAGDFDGDGFADAVIASPYGGPKGVSESSVIYGSKSYKVSITVSSLASSSDGFSINGVSGNGNFYSVSGVGKVNGDPYDDIIAAADENTDTGRTYVIYGGSVRPDSISLAKLTSTQGFEIVGAEARYSSY